jgi:cytochrome P450
MDPDVQRCPFHAYAEVRKSGPVYLDPQSGFYTVVDYNVIRELVADTATFSNVTGMLLVKNAPYQDKIDTIFREHGYLPVNTLVVSDPPAHKFHRALVEKAFTAGRVKSMEDYIGGVIDGLIDAFADQGKIDFVKALAIPVPMFVIGDALGMPRGDLDKLHRWSDAVIQEGDQSNDEERQTAITWTLVELHQYIAARANEYRANPANNILSDLVHADIDGQKLTMPELVAIMIQLLVGGNETTTSAMAAGLYRMIEDNLEDQLRNDPSLIPNFVEEVLRMDAPVQCLFRRATRDTEIAGTKIPAQSIVILRWGAGNRDPNKFVDPDKFDLKRGNARQHMTFGMGPHFCIGNQLARGELRLAFTKLLAKLKNFRIAPGQSSIERHPHFFAYGMSRLDVTFERMRR